MILNPIKPDLNPTSKPVVLYGCGKRGKEIYDLHHKLGWSILCFCDGDANKLGQAYKGVTIRSADEIKNLYAPDSYYVYCTMKFPQVNELIKASISDGVFKDEQILNATDLWYGKNCTDLCRQLVLEPDGLSYCCDGRGRPLHIISKVRGNAEESVSSFLEARDRIIAQNQAPDAPCAECPELVEGYWPTSFQLLSINFADFHLCQTRCYYCNNSVHDIHEWEKIQYDSLSIARLLFDKSGSRYLPPAIVHGNGELSINPRLNALLTFVRETSANFRVLTNAGTYSLEIAELLKASPDVELNVSLDCGTADTYKKVKGVPMFEQVVNNLRRYRENTENISLKYIILPENINDADIDGFIDFCRSLDIKNFSISYNDNEDNSSLDMDGVVIPAFKLASKAKNNKINVALLGVLGESNLAQIRLMLKRTERD